MVVKNKSAHCIHRLSRSLKRLGRSVGRCNERSNINQVMKNARIKNMVIGEVGKLLRKDMMIASSKQNHSLFKIKNISSLENFDWLTFLNEFLLDESTLSKK
jgi:hypothetical protein